MKKSFTNEFKENAIRRARQNSNVAGTARELGVHSSTLWRWMRELDVPEEVIYLNSGHLNRYKRNSGELWRIHQDYDLADTEYDRNVIIKKGAKEFGKTPAKIRQELERCRDAIDAESGQRLMDARENVRVRRELKKESEIDVVHRAVRTGQIGIILSYLWGL